MKKGVRIVNCARGELVVEADLAEALKSGQVAGAALDVFHEEPPKNSPFAALDNIILTPHIAGSTAEAQEAVGMQIAMQVREYLKSGVAQNAVNLPSLTHEEYQEMAPYMSLAERLGTFLVQFPKGSIDTIQIAYHGRLAETKTELIRNSAIAGVLGHLEQVNRINAASVAAERGIRLHEEKKEAPLGGAGSVLQLTLHAGRHQHLRQRRHPPRRLTPASPSRRHRHRGASAGNPAHHPQSGRAGRHRPHRHHPRQSPDQHRQLCPRPLERQRSRSRPRALAVLQIDGEVTDAVLKELRAAPAITGVRQVTL